MTARWWQGHEIPVLVRESRRFLGRSVDPQNSVDRRAEIMPNLAVDGPVSDSGGDRASGLSCATGRHHHPAAKRPEMTPPRSPVLHQIHTRVWLTDLLRGLGRNATLYDIPDAELDHVARMGFDWVWLLSVWQTYLYMPAWGYHVFDVTAG